MKKVFMGMFALATMLLATSCSEDEIVAQSSGNEVTVSFTAQLRSDVKTKAVGDDTDNVDQMIFAVYDESDKELVDLRQTITSFEEADNGKKTTTVNVVLVKGQTYSFAFWAQDSEYTAYKFDPATAEVTVNYGQTANNKSADAFFANVTNYTVNGSFEMDVTLKRPFAQVNFLVTEAELKAAKAAGFEPAQSSVTVQNAATSLNVLTGEVEGNTEATFNLANLISNEETTTIKNAEGNYIAWSEKSNAFVSKENENNATDFNYLATAYFLPTSATGVTTISAATQVKASSTSKSPVDVAVAKASAQRNYRTNIYGSLLTSQGKIYVTIDPAFDGEYGSEYEDPTTQVVGTIEEANQLFAAETPATNVTITTVPTTASTIILPKTTEDVTINFSYGENANPAQVTIKYAEGATEKPANITVNGDGGDLVIDTPNSTATVNGDYNSVTATTAPNTLIVPKGVTIETLTIKGGNAEIYYGAVTGTVTNEGEGTITWLVDSKAQLEAIATAVNTGTTFSKETIELTSDINLNNEEWTPIAKEGYKFQGTFDGKNYTVSNFKVTEQEGYAGLFGNVHVGTVNNITVKNVLIEAKHYAGGIVGKGYVKMDNCHVDNVQITLSIDPTANDYGDKAGGIIGQNSEGGMTVTNCSAKNVTITGYRDLGGLMGMAHYGNIVTNNNVENITINQVIENGYKDEQPTTLEAVIGRRGVNGNTTVTESGNTYSNVNINVPVSENITLENLSQILTNGNVNVTLSGDVKGEAITTAPYGNKTGLIQNGGVIDGNGYKLSVTGDESYAVMTAGGTIKNLTVDEGYRGIMIMSPEEDVILENVISGGENVGYALNTGEGDFTQNLIAEKCTFKGWSSWSNIKSATFTSCNFGLGAYWQKNSYGIDYDRLVKPYVTTVFESCVFKEKFYIDLSALGNNGEDPSKNEYKVIDEDATVTLTNCTCNGTVITAENYKEFITVEQGTTGHLIIGGTTIF